MANVTGTSPMSHYAALGLRQVEGEKKEKKIQIQMDENTELNAFCSLIQTPFGETSYEQYEEALSTTKKGRILSNRSLDASFIMAEL